MEFNSQLCAAYDTFAQFCENLSSSAMPSAPEQVLRQAVSDVAQRSPLLELGDNTRYFCLWKTTESVVTERSVA